MPKNSLLSGKRILVTRPARGAETFAAALREVGAIPIVAPTIEFQPPDDAFAAVQAVRTARNHAWIVFTSATGVDAFFDRLDEQREDARALGDAKVAAIGIKTSQALRERGVYSDLVPQSFVAEDLAQALIVASQTGDEILIYRAQEARDVLPERLSEAGRKPLVVAAYKTVTRKDPQLAEKVASCDVVTFTSASTVRGFAQNLGGSSAAADAAKEKIVACIGLITAQEAQAMGIRVDAVAQEYTADGLLRALERTASAT